MACEKEQMTQKLQRWAERTASYRLPEWETIPDFGLYMDQVVVLLQQYLDFIPADGEGKDSFVTAATINNYVRLKLMPPPVKKKYSRVHLGYLVLILTLKLSLGISEIRRLLPADLEEPAARALYDDFRTRFDRTRTRFAAQLTDAARELADGGSETTAAQLVMEYSLSAACCTLLAGRLLGLESGDADFNKS